MLVGVVSNDDEMKLWLTALVGDLCKRYSQRYGHRLVVPTNDGKTGEFIDVLEGSMVSECHTLTHVPYCNGSSIEINRV